MCNDRRSRRVCLRAESYIWAGESKAKFGAWRRVNDNEGALSTWNGTMWDNGFIATESRGLERLSIFEFSVPKKSGIRWRRVRMDERLWISRAVFFGQEWDSGSRLGISPCVSFDWTPWGQVTGKLIFVLYLIFILVSFGLANLYLI
jgi:hypothetical protein